MESELLPHPAGKGSGSAPLGDLQETSLAPARHCKCCRKQINEKTANIEQEKRGFFSLNRQKRKAKKRQMLCWTSAL